MMNKIFVGMLLLGIGVGAFLGNMDQVALAFVDSSKEAVQLAIVMLGVVGMWTGIMKVAEEAGIARGLARIFRPVIEILYPSLKGKEAEKARYYIAENMAANFLGLGWAATPTGLKAMEELKKVKEFQEPMDPKEEASEAMCMFLLINVSSLQLIPVNIIAYRSQYGSVNPTAIILPAMIATLVSTLVAVIYGKWKIRNRTK
ncbi:MAG: nucleoside recognition protein [Lachnospiraceae bacterium]|nr:nucleoside recognition protein [Lachnospiraceae bacterium]